MIARADGPFFFFDRRDVHGENAEPRFMVTLFKDTQSSRVQRIFGERCFEEMLEVIRKSKRISMFRIVEQEIVISISILLCSIEFIFIFSFSCFSVSKRSASLPAQKASRVNEVRIRISHSIVVSRRAKGWTVRRRRSRYEIARGCSLNGGE